MNEIVNCVDEDKPLPDSSHLMSSSTTSTTFDLFHFQLEEALEMIRRFNRSDKIRAALLWNIFSGKVQLLINDNNECPEENSQPTELSTVVCSKLLDSDYAGGEEKLGKNIGDELCEMELDLELDKLDNEDLEEHLADQQDQDEEKLSATEEGKMSKGFKCPQCSACFTTRGNLNVHNRIHSGERPYGCGKCGSRFTTGGNLRRHMLSHAGLKPYRCSTCDSCFTEKKSLLAHQRSHTGEKPFGCPDCNRRFSQKSVLAGHMISHSKEKPHLCHQCGKAFKQNSQLAKHSRRHFGRKEHSCNSCQAAFFTKGDLERHMKVHTGEKKYVCEKCGKSFARKTGLTEHVNRHLGLKPLKCSYCDKSFSDPSTYHKHIKKHLSQQSGNAINVQ